MYKFIPCSKCVDGYIIDKIGATPCICRKEYKNNILTFDKYIKANLVKTDSSPQAFTDIKDLTLTNYCGPDKPKNLEKIDKYVRRFIRKYNNLNLFFGGKPGTQKSTMARYIAKELIARKQKVYYVLANKLIQTIISAERDETDEDLINYMTGVDFLVIDEFDEDKIVTYQSGWQNKHLHSFLKTRLEIIKKATLFISNKPITDLGNYFDISIQDLIQRSVPDKTMIFEDVYFDNAEIVRVEDIWK